MKVIHNIHCKCCAANSNDFIILNTTKEYSGIEMAVNRQGMLRIRVYDENEHDDEIFLTQDILELDYCPLCGNAFSKD